MISYIIRYGKFQGIVWSILGFSLKKDKDIKDMKCVELWVCGKLNTPDVGSIKVKFTSLLLQQKLFSYNQGIWPLRKANTLV